MNLSFKFQIYTLLCDVFNKLPDFFVWAFKIVIVRCDTQSVFRRGWGLNTLISNWVLVRKRKI